MSSYQLGFQKCLKAKKSSMNNGTSVVTMVKNRVWFSRPHSMNMVFIYMCGDFALLSEVQYNHFVCEELKNKVLGTS